MEESPTEKIDLDKYYMQMALKEAEAALKHDDVPVGAVLIHQKRLIAKAHNQIELLRDPTAHAEMIAITQAAAELKAERLTDTTLYVTLEPCAMCAGAMVLSRIKRLVFAARDPKAGACGSLMNIVRDPRLNHRVEVEEGVLAGAASEMLQSFFRKLRKDIV